MKKRIGSLFLVLALCFTLLPTTAFAAEMDFTVRKFVTNITPSAPDPGPAPIFGRVIRLHDLDLAA